MQVLSDTGSSHEMPGNLRPLGNRGCLKTLSLCDFETIFGIFSKYFEKWGMFSKYFENLPLFSKYFENLPIHVFKIATNPAFQRTII